MFNNLSISGEEFRAIAPRVALYTAVAYVTIRAVSAGVAQVSRLVGLTDKR